MDIDSEKLEGLIKSFGDFLAHILGEQTEVVIHDMKKDCIIWIKNGHITGRKLGEGKQKDTIVFLGNQMKKCGDAECITGYKSATCSGTQLKASTMLLKDEAGEVRYAICVNQDITAFTALQEQLNAITGTVPLMQSECQKAGNLEEETVEEITLKIIVEEIEKAKPFSIASKEHKLRILRRLDEKGLFEIRGATAQVCEALHIAQPTFYKYIKEIKSGVKNDTTDDTKDNINNLEEI